MMKSKEDCHRIEQKALATSSVESVMRRFPELSEALAQQRVREAQAFVASQPRNPLQEEVDARRMQSDLWTELTMIELVERLARLGYKLDRNSDCRHVARWMTGPRAGQGYPSVGMRVVQADDGISFSHVDARRDTCFDELQRTLRGCVYVVGKTAIYEI